MAEDKKEKKKNSGLFSRKSSTLETTFIETGVIGLDLHISNGRGIPVGGIIEFPALYGVGKCHGKGTKILMYDGSIKNVEDVVVGDQLMGDDSTPRNVLSLARGRENMHRVIPKKGEPHTCNASHILSLEVSRPFRNHVKSDIINISIKDYLAENSNFKTNTTLYRRKVEFGEQPIAVDPYIYGIWIGDGATACKRITTGDVEVAKAWNDYATSIGLTSHKEYTKKGANCVTYAVGSSQRRDKVSMDNPLHNLIKASTTTGAKRICREYMINSTENRLKLLAGIIDTDGYVDPRNHALVTISTKLEGLAEDYLFLARSLGYQATLKRRDKYVKFLKDTYTSYDIIISGNLEEIPTRVPRRKFSTRKINKDWRRVGFDLEDLGEGDYYGFQLDGNHLYLLGDFIVTHNTTLNGEVAKRLILKHRNLGIPFKVAYIDIENSLDLLKSLGLQEFIESGDLIHIPGVVTYEELEEFYKDIFLKRVKDLEDVKLVIIDSITAVTTEKKEEMSCEGAEFGLKAKANTAFMEKLAPKSLQYGVTTFLVNQMRDKQNAGMYEEKEKRQGGKAQGYYATAIVRLTKKTSKADKDIKPIKIQTAFGEVEVQKKCIVTLKSDGADLKNRYGKMQPVDILIEYGKKVHNWFTLRNMLIGLGYIEQAGARFNISAELEPEKTDKTFSLKEVNTFVGQNIGRLVEFLKSRNQYRVNLEEIENDEFA